MADLPSKKAAPRREVLEVLRDGEWGEVVYRHRLSCGHVDVRKRPARTEVVACQACAAGKMLDQRAPAETAPGRRSDESDPLFDMFADEAVAIEMTVNQVRAGLAARFGVPVEAIDVVMGEGVAGQVTLAYATVFLDAVHARRLAGALM